MIHPYYLLLLGAIVILALSCTEFYRRRKGCRTFFYAVPAVIISALLMGASPRYTPGGSILSFTHHIIPAAVLIGMICIFWIKIRMKDYPWASAGFIVVIAVILTLAINDTVAWAGRSHLRNNLIGL